MPGTVTDDRDVMVKYAVMETVAKDVTKIVVVVVVNDGGHGTKDICPIYW